MSSFVKLQNSLIKITDKIDIAKDTHPVYKRFFESFNIKFQNRSLLDIAILFRQILLIETSQRGVNNFATLQVPINSKWPSKKEWTQVGIHAEQVNSLWEIYAEWWTPNWLDGSHIQPVDYCSIHEFNKREEINFPTNATDIFLNQCGSKYSKYTSIDQQKAIRATLSLSRGQTLAISLPTGEGKSLVFKAINSIGFFDTKNKGLTLVIVPTVTLALDQEKDIQNEKNNQEVYAYVGQRDEHNKLLKERIKLGEQDICFVSPEAVYGPLRQVLLESAKNGNIRSIVIDEAHIIEEWGTGFRREYQLFSGLWRQLLESSPKTNQFRTILLSATFMQESINLIRILFSFNKNSFEVYSATKLRPEIDYWITDIIDDQNIREQRVSEAVLHLPRPLILYTTKVNDAKYYYKSLKEYGFKNIEIIHGKSSTKNRNSVVEQWKSGSLDVVVATSAFGLGIDYPHTRSIIHACIPETLNRFYQEVGRGGRDGKSSISLLIPTSKDLSIAKSMNSEKFISNENAYDRWKSMFTSKGIVHDKSDEYIIDLGKSPSQKIDYSTKGYNRDWNTHVILLMARAKLLQLVAIPSLSTEEYSFANYNRYITIRVINEYHLDKEVWSIAINPIRLDANTSNSKSINLLQTFMKKQICPADIFSEIYKFSLDDADYGVSLLCSDCTLCRNSNKKYTIAPLKRSFPVKSIIQNEIFELLSSSSIMVEFNENSFDRLFNRSFSNVLTNLVSQGIQNFIFIGNSLDLFLTDRIRLKIDMKPIFIEHIDKLSNVLKVKQNLPKKASVILIGTDVKIDNTIIDILKNKNTIVFLKKGTVDPITPNRLLSDVYQNELMQLNEFINKVGI